MKPRLDDVVSVAVVSAVAAIFLAETIALWPEPMRFKDFKLIIENPFASPSKQPDRSTRAGFIFRSSAHRPEPAP